MSARFLMIALDGADGVRLDRWSTDGTLPALTELRAGGDARRLIAPEGITDDALWASFKYAAGVGEHGRYHWRQRLDTGEMGMAYKDEAGRSSFWESLSEKGNRVAVFDLPKCGLPRPLQGIHLADWLVHGRYFSRPKSYPESLAPDILERFGCAPPSRCGYDVPRLDDDEVRDVVSNLFMSVSMKRSAGLAYLESEAWDLFMIGFKEAHCAGHHLWDLVDPRHPGYSAERAAVLGHPLESVYRRLDAAVGDLIQASGNPDAIVVFSTTDMVPNSTLSHLMPEIVHRLNRRFGDNALTRTVRRATRQSAGGPCELLPYNDNCAALRVNPEWNPFQRQGAGGDKVMPLLDQIESLLRGLNDAETGLPVVNAIDRPSTEIPGRRAAGLPDLLVRYPTGIIPKAVTSPVLGRVEAPPPPKRPGDHAAGGLLIARGVSIAGVHGMQDLGPLASGVLARRQFSAS